MDTLQAIYSRRSVRHYTEVPVPQQMVMDVIRAAAQAPSALNAQPWAFAVVRGAERLNQYSIRAKQYMLLTLPDAFTLHRRADTLVTEDYHAFHSAGTVIIIYARPTRYNPTEDCCLAAQNLMLAAHAMGLGTCPIGFVRPWFNLPEIKAELDIPDDLEAAMPIVVGWPAKTEPPVFKTEPQIVKWLEDSDPERDAGAK
jgi:nitroreductase